MKPSVAKIPWQLVPVIALAGCGGSGSGELFTVRDSAGIRIAESATEAFETAPIWSVRPEPLLTLASEDDPSRTFFRVRAGAFLESGEVALANSGTSEIRIFGPTGDLTRTLGAPGQGPGEFSNLVDLEVLPGDSLVAFDRGLRRVTVFTPEGEVAIDAALEWPSRGPAQELVLLRDGQFGVFIGWSSALAPRNDMPIGRNRLEQPLYVFERNERAPHAAVGLPGIEMYSPEPNHWILALLPRVSVVGSRDGDLVVGRGETYQFEVMNPVGQLKEIIRVRGNTPLSDDELQALRERRVAYRNTTPEMRQHARETLEILPTPDFKPPYTYLVVDDVGRIWASEFSWYGILPTHWTVFGTDGQLRGRIELPEQFRLLAVQGDRLLGVQLDEFEVEYPQVLRVDSRSDQ